MSFSLRLGDCSISQQLLNVVTLKDPVKYPISATLSGNGSINVDPPSLRVDELPARGVWTVRIGFSGLTPWTGYVYSVQQDSEVLDGSFQTPPIDQNTAFSFVIGTCDGIRPFNPTNTFHNIRRLVESSAVPVIHMFIIDDVHYTDEFTVNDADTGLVSTGKPQDTAIGADYAKAWVANYGLLPSESKWMLPDRQWVYRNLSCCYSGGDHAIAGNWCRGNVDPDSGDKMKKPCDRGADSLEDIAGAEWEAFFGCVNPTPLRPGEWYWGKELGPVRLSLWDMSKHCEPYDGRVWSDTQCYGARQLADHMNYLDVDTHPFKIAFHESGLTRIGQSWLEQHRAEAQAWLKDMNSRPNLNGTDGNFIVIYGDNHTAHTLKLDEFWAWSAGTLGDASAVVFYSGDNWGWGAVPQYFESAAVNTKDRFIHNFILVTVHADKSPKYVEVAHVDGGRGIVKYAARLTHGAPRNQMVSI